MKIKPQLIQTSVSNETKRKLTIVIAGGAVQDVIKENIENVSVEIHDYDVDESDPHTLKKDDNGESYQLIKLD